MNEITVPKNEASGDWTGEVPFCIRLDDAAELELPIGLRIFDVPILRGQDGLFWGGATDQGSDRPRRPPAPR